MPLSAPTTARTPQHIRTVNFRSYEREDGLWDIEGELLDTKAVDIPMVYGNGVRKAGAPVHLMHLRLTVNTRLVVQSLEAVMDAHPLQGCPAALEAMQRLVGCSMAWGWRKSIETHLGGVVGCTHIRELLNSMATAAFQSILSAFTPQPGEPPAFLGRCMGWRFDGDAVAQFYPQFVKWNQTPRKDTPSAEIPAAAPQPPHKP